MEALKAEYRKKIAEQKELAKVLDRRLAKVVHDMNEKQKKKLGLHSEADEAKFEKMEEEAMCGAIQDKIRSTTDTLLQQKLVGAIVKLTDDDMNKLVQTDLYGDLIAFMQNYIDTRSVGALKKNLEALKKEADDIRAENDKVVEIMKNLQERLACTEGEKKLREIVDTRKEKTKLLKELQEKVGDKRQRMQILAKQKEELLKNIQKQEQKIKDFRILELIEDADVLSIGEQSSVAEKYSVAEQSSDQQKAGEQSSDKKKVGEE